MKTKTSSALFAKAKQRIPGGVNSPVRAFRSVGLDPRFIERGKGAYVFDADGNRYVDYVGSWGPLLFGHAQPRIVKAVRDAASRGTSFGAPTEMECRMAELVCSMVPSVEMVRMVNSGTEATMSAIRLARAITRRDKIVKFEGCYHGHGDSFLIKAGSGAMTFGVPDSPGVPAALAAETLSARFNDIASVRALCREHAGKIAAVIVEPVVGNMGCVPPVGNFLHELRELCTQEGIVFIMDEVMTGFRLARGGAQELFGISPDLTTMGKIIGGGLPVGAYGGKRLLMELVSPSGPMYQAGTLSGNPLAMAAGIEMLKMIRERRGVYRELERLGKHLEEGIVHNLRATGVPGIVNRVGSMFTLFFTDMPVTDYASAARSDTKRFAAYFRGMLEQNIYLPPSQFEAAFISASHTERIVEQTIKASRRALEHLS